MKRRSFLKAVAAGCVTPLAFTGTRSNAASETIVDSGFAKWCPRDKCFRMANGTVIELRHTSTDEVIRGPLRICTENPYITPADCQ